MGLLVTTTSCSTTTGGELADDGEVQLAGPLAGLGPLSGPTVHCSLLGSTPGMLEKGSRSPGTHPSTWADQ